MRINGIRAWTLVLFIVSLVCKIAVSDDASAKPAKPEIVWDELAVRVTNEQGTPVEGVKVTPWALGSRSGHGWWRREKFGKPETNVSDQHGKLAVKYPRFHDDRVKVERVSVSIDHPDYCWGEFTTDIGNLVNITVKRGTQLRIKTFTPEGKGSLADVIVMHAHLYVPPSSMQRIEDDWIVTQPVAGESGAVRGVSIAQNAPLRFSSSLTWSRRDDGVPQVVVLTLEKGILVKGKLSDDVPRPIKRGQVSVQCLQLNDVEAPWSVWGDYAEIQPDGTFTFESLPPGTDLHFIAMCEGFASAKPSQERFDEICERYEDKGIQYDSYAMYPQVFTPESGNVDVTLEMIPTLDVVLRAHDKAGNPVEGVQLGVNPNQYIFQTGALVAGKCYRTKEFLLDPDFDWANSFSNFPYHGYTDANGEVRISNLMVCNVSLRAWPNEKWELPEVNGRRSLSVKLNPDTKQVDVLLIPRTQDSAK
ncbi:MAG: hypothetical protein KDA69_14850 [Planctomycetaceae bacterium]|nr:hypothetical protein [Planctomycetaceae bacterium]MCA9045603.1 hypothetical protein [Planctomycetaceae bacterium]